MSAASPELPEESEPPAGSDEVTPHVRAIDETLSNREISRPLSDDAAMRQALEPMAGGPVAFHPVVEMSSLRGDSPDDGELFHAGELSGSDNEELSVTEFERRLTDAKMASLAEFAAGAGHEIHNPLATIAGRVQLLLLNESHPERRRSLGIILAQALRVRDMIGDLMLFARPPEPNPVSIDVQSAIAVACERLAPEADALGCCLRQSDGPAVTACCDPDHLQVILAEIIRNGLEAAAAGGTVHVDLRSEASRTIIEVQDSGDGWTPLDREHAFDPFYSGRQAGRGLGFGLSKCWRLLQMNGGNLSLPVDAAGITRVRIELPAKANSLPAVVS